MSKPCGRRAVLDVAWRVAKDGCQVFRYTLHSHHRQHMRTIYTNSCTYALPLMHWGLHLEEPLPSGMSM